MPIIKYIIVLACLPSVAFAGPGASSNAETLCMVMDNTRSIAPCAVDEGQDTVTINIKLMGEDADEVCRRVQQSLVKEHMFFDGGHWRLTITTPASGGKAVASCDLPQTPG